MDDFDTKTIISDDTLVRNVELFKHGDMDDKKCSECDLSSILHPHPKKHHCDLIVHKKEFSGHLAENEIRISE